MSAFFPKFSKGIVLKLISDLSVITLTQGTAIISTVHNHTCLVTCSSCGNVWSFCKSQSRANPVHIFFKMNITIVKVLHITKYYTQTYYMFHDDSCHSTLATMPPSIVYTALGDIKCTLGEINIFITPSNETCSHDSSFIIFNKISLDTFTLIVFWLTISNSNWCF